VKPRTYGPVGWVTDPQGDMALDEERAMIAGCSERILREEGVRPRGWLSPWISESLATPDLLKEAGYTYTLNWSVSFLHFEVCGTKLLSNP
jgi:peptidoglycan/xylan/chitin deacetylase (PgdA/CDA1 family)